MELSLLAPLLTLVTLYVLYWIIRLGVSHGVQDAARHLAPTPAQAQVSDVIRRQRKRYGDDEA